MLSSVDAIGAGGCGIAECEVCVKGEDEDASEYTCGVIGGERRGEELSVV